MHHRAYLRGDVFAQTACTHRGQLQTRWTGLWAAGSNFRRVTGSCAIHKSRAIILARKFIVSMLVSLVVHIRWRRSKSLICMSASNARAEAWLHEFADSKQTDHSSLLVSRLADSSVGDGDWFLVEAKL